MPGEQSGDDRTAEALLLPREQHKAGSAGSGPAGPGPATVDDSAGGSRSLKILLLGLLVFQASFALVIGRYTRTSVPTEDLYEISHLVLVIEVTKFVLSNLLEYFSTDGRLMESLQEHILERPLSDSLKVLIPAVLYVIQNSLTYIGLSNLNAPVFISLQQGKVITTALVSVFMLKRSYRFKHWMCLIALAAGVAIIAVGEQGDNSKEFVEEVEAIDGTVVEELGNNSPLNNTVLEQDALNQQFLIGFCAVMGGCFSSAFAGVYFEKILAPEKAACTKERETFNSASVISTAVPIGDPKYNLTEANTERQHLPSLWMRNIQLSFFCIIFAYLQGLTDKQAEEKTSGFFDFASVYEDEDNGKSYLHGFNGWVWLLVALQAMGGLLCAAVMKYADNVMKGLANGISLVVASIISVFLLKAKLSSTFPLGAAIIFLSVYFFANDLPGCHHRWVGRVEPSEAIPLQQREY